MQLAIFGAGGLGREFLELAEIINERGQRWDSFVFIDDNTPLKAVQGIPVYRFEDMFADGRVEETEYIIAVGEPAVRKKIYERLLENGCSVATIVHPDVHIPVTTTLGPGTVVCYGCFVSCNVTIKENVVLQPQCNIGHDDVIGAHSVISGFVNMGGACTIGEASYIGLSACVRELTEIGARSIVGMGAVVMRNVEDEAVVAGNPARKMLSNTDQRVFHH